MGTTVSRERLTHEERRDGILRAALRLFAERGFHGTTTRALAEAAGISEALLFRHFPSKEELYVELQSACWRLKKQSKASKAVEALDDSTASLVALVHFLMAKMLRPAEEVDEVEQSLHRMLANSYLEDGVFARGFMKEVGRELIAKLSACVKAAAAAGDLVEAPLQEESAAWLVEHLAAMLMLNLMPGQPVVSLALDRSKQIEQATWFALLGLGLKAEAVRRHYHAQGFALLTA